MRNHFVQAATLLLATLLLASGVWSASLSAQLTEADLVGCYDVSASGEWRLEESGGQRNRPDGRRVAESHQAGLAETGHPIHGQPARLPLSVVGGEAHRQVAGG